MWGAIELASLLATAGVSAPQQDGLGTLPRRPAAFLENRGQFATDAGYVGFLDGMVARVEPSAIWLQRPPGRGESAGVVVRQVFEGASKDVVLEGEDEQPALYSWFIGNDQQRWVHGLKGYSRLRMRNLYPGIDLVLQSGESGLKYDLLLAPGADPSQIRIRFDGVEQFAIRENGILEATTSGGPLLQRVGKTWQVRPDGSTRSLSARHRLLDATTFGFEVLDRDPSLPTVIDPALYWATYIGTDWIGGGVAESVSSLALDSSGDIVAAGWAGTTGFPVTPGAYVNTTAQDQNVFVAKFDRNTGALRFASQLGGSSQYDAAQAVALDPEDRPTVTGSTLSSDFPTTPGSFDTVKSYFGVAPFVFRLTATGSNLIYSTFLEGSVAGSSGHAIAVTTSGSAIVGGETAAFDFPVTPGALDTTFSGPLDGFITRLDPTGNHLEWSTFVGGSSSDWVERLATDSAGTVTASGQTVSLDFPTTPGCFQSTCHSCANNSEAFVTRIAPDGASILWSTLLGGSYSEWPLALTLDRFGGVILAGKTESLDFPVTPGAFQDHINWNPPDNFFGDAFLTYIDPTGSALIYSTYLGDTYLDEIRGVAVDPSGVVTVAGWGGLIPVTPGALDTTFNTGNDGFICRFDPRGQRQLYSTYLGGPSEDYLTCIAMGRTGRVSVGGHVYWGGFPTTPGAFDPTYNGGQTDGVLATLDLYLQGIEPYGRSTPSCQGPLVANATRMPVGGASDFGLWCNAAPPNIPGFLILGRNAASPAFLLGGARIFVDPSSGALRLPVHSTAAGYVECTLPPLSGPPGTRLFAQFLFPNPPGCGSAWCASDALAITVQ